jgi:hypothetical protein
MEYPGSPWYTARHWENDAVWDTDFYDPEVTGQSYDSDNSQFDALGTVISYFDGHGGDASQIAGTQPCNHNYECVTPPQNDFGPGKCVTYPQSNLIVPGYQGQCRFGSYHQGDVRNKAIDKHGNVIQYAQNGNPIKYFGTKWGESSTSGPNPGWADAGTNGGTNLVIMNISFGTWPDTQLVDLSYPFAGLHIFSTTLTVAGDKGDFVGIGDAYGQYIVQNPTFSAGQAWGYAMTTLSGTMGQPCTANYSQGGGEGYNGCGCNLSFNANINSGASNWNVNIENWSDLQNDGFDVWGQGWGTWFWACNYNANNYSWGLP